MIGVDCTGGEKSIFYERCFDPKRDSNGEMSGNINSPCREVVGRDAGPCKVKKLCELSDAFSAFAFDCLLAVGADRDDSDGSCELFLKE